MPSISMPNENFTEEMGKELRNKRLHPEGEYSFRCVAIEFNSINNIPKSHNENFLFFHWRSEQGIITDYCTLSPRASFQLANRVKALQAIVSNPMVINYTGLIGRIAKLEIIHEEKEGESRKYKVANVKYFNIDQKVEKIDISNNVYQNYPTTFKGYEITTPEDKPQPQRQPQPQAGNYYAQQNFDEKIEEDDLPF